MCRVVTCKSCSKPTWAGCGQHVEQVLGHVRPADRCSCREAVSPAPESASESGSPSSQSFLGRLFGQLSGR